MRYKFILTLTCCNIPISIGSHLPFLFRFSVVTKHYTRIWEGALFLYAETLGRQGFQMMKLIQINKNIKNYIKELKFNM
jgi:hypothetical protein